MQDGGWWFHHTTFMSLYFVSFSWYGCNICKIFNKEIESIQTHTLSSKDINEVLKSGNNNTNIMRNAVVTLKHIIFTECTVGEFAGAYFKWFWWIMFICTNNLELI